MDIFLFNGHTISYSSMLSTGIQGIFKSVSYYITAQHIIVCVCVSAGATIITDGSFGNGDKYSFIDSVSCAGTEKTLSDCSMTMQENCLPKCTSNIAIRCYGEINTCNNDHVLT